VARAITGAARDLAFIGERLFGAMEDFFQGDLDVESNVRALRATRWPLPVTSFTCIRSPEKLLNNLSKRVRIRRACGACGTYSSKSIILSAFLGVTQHFIGLVDELEFFFGLGVIGVSVGVILEG
jgi:hypothetical protein